ncbi:MAG: bifunctional precorrin-2 dehydrogenase/sirohydrochlorin ferrochelatase [Leptospiraceae bacterium]|nr:bifunctional precorrin-2 dehydrogenase/sirohydrochlorin ferrochelatase [Leptospiraceae bacterium]MCP5495163.1 bifunctional precorrin-2 dehydrogenase/sirohydrochlorin ferrochelatase [Leptospiraceae bacterium]
MSDSKLFPVFLNLDEKDVLVVGGGNVALEKLISLRMTGAMITLIAKEISEKTREYIKSFNRITVLEREIETRDLDDRFLIFAATNNSTLNAELRKYAKQKKIWINAVDDPPNCDFYSASVVDKGPIRIAISTNGGFPGISKVLRKALEIVLPDTDKDSFQKLFGIRKKLQETITNSKERSKVLKEVIATIEEKYFQLKSLEELNKNGRDT